MSKTYCNIASLPERVTTLEKTVASILPQVDYLFVALNNYTEVPKFLHGSPKIKYALLDNKFTDAAKFMGVDEYDGYVLTLDDDLIVPRNYVAYLKDGVDKYKSIVSLHGKKMNPKPVHSFYHGFERAYMCLSVVKDDVQVDVVGSGVMCFHTDFFKITPDDCPVEKVADVHVAKKAKQLGVDMWVLKHEGKYLEHIKHDYCIYSDNHNNRDQIATKLYNSF